MIVLDASALVAALIEDSDKGRAANAALQAEPDWAAPRHILAETLAAVRGQVLRRTLSDDDATRVVAELRSLAFTWVEMDQVLDRVWEMRNGVTVYGAAYVAAAELLGCPLMTTNERLARYPGARCNILVPGKDVPR
jgi:predicted nucleic acid-binding protein